MEDAAHTCTIARSSCPSGFLGRSTWIPKAFFYFLDSTYGAFLTPKARVDEIKLNLDFLFFIPFNILALLSPSLPVVTQIRGHIAARPPPPSPLRYVPSFFIARTQHFLPWSTRVELCAHFIQQGNAKKNVSGFIQYQELDIRTT